jgi:acyl dehydratase
MMGLFLEEIGLSNRISLGSHKFTISDMKRYALQFDPVGFHVDEDAGRASIYGAMTAAGLHVACGWMACFVDSNAKARHRLAAAGKALLEIGPSPGFKDMRWLKPVLAGDRISYFTTPMAKRPLGSRPGWGLLTSYNEGVNQHGELVFTFEGAVLTALRLN